MTAATPPRLVLTLSCADRAGIVGAVGTFLADHRCNILESAPFGDPDTGRFMMRVSFERLDGAPDLAALTAAFSAVGNAFGMQWQLHDASVRARVLLMVSKFDHCLNDLLYRYRVGALAMEPVAVVSNHRDTYQLAASYNVPFHHLPITPGTREAETYSPGSRIAAPNSHLAGWHPCSTRSASFVGATQACIPPAAPQALRAASAPALRCDSDR